MEAPPDLDERTEAVRVQILELYKLNSKLGKNCEHLSTAIQCARQRGLLDDNEFRSLEALNRRANAAKHEGLGKETPALPRARPVVVEVQDMPLHNYVGELERAYATRLGRPLRKNEPRYRYEHRPHNLGEFMAIVCLDALEQPIEFIGDSHLKKQDAKHLAALQAVLYLSLPAKEGSADPGEVQAAAPVSRGLAMQRSGSARRPREPSALPKAGNQVQTEEPLEGSQTQARPAETGCSQTLAAPSEDGLQDGHRAAPRGAGLQERRTQATLVVNMHEDGSQPEAANSLKTALLEEGLQGPCTQHEGGAQHESGIQHAQHEGGTPQHEGGAQHVSGTLRDGDAQYKDGAQHEGGIPHEGYGHAQAAQERRPLERSCAGQSPQGLVLPPREAVLSRLRSEQRPLALREVYLLSLNRDPKTEQMGSGVKKEMNRMLAGLLSEGCVKSSSGLWSAV